MFCPDCGQRQIVSNARFCSNCGFQIAELKQFLDRRLVGQREVEPQPSAAPDDTITLSFGTPMEEIERQFIIFTLDKAGGNKTKTAELLHISLKTLYNKLNSYRQRDSN